MNTTCKFGHERTFLVLVDVHLKVEWLGHMVTLCLTHWGSPQCSLPHSRFLSAVFVGRDPFHHIVETFFSIYLFYFSPLHGCELLVLDCIFENYNILIFCNIKKCWTFNYKRIVIFIRLFIFALLSCKNYLCILVTRPFPDIQFENIFSYAMSCQFNPYNQFYDKLKESFFTLFFNILLETFLIHI